MCPETRASTASRAPIKQHVGRGLAPIKQQASSNGTSTPGLTCSHQATRGKGRCSHQATAHLSATRRSPLGNRPPPHTLRHCLLGGAARGTTHKSCTPRAPCILSAPLKPKREAPPEREGGPGLALGDLAPSTHSGQLNAVRTRSSPRVLEPGRTKFSRRVDHCAPIKQHSASLPSSSDVASPRG